MVSACHVKEKGVIDGIKRPRNFGRALCVAVVLHGQRRGQLLCLSSKTKDGRGGVQVHCI